MTGAGAEDRRFMRRCLALARQAEGRTSPNPIVGCVIVGSDGRVLAEGYHRAAGQPHAEADALAKLGGQAPGATLYVNLEPCQHTEGRRTEPCLPKVIAAGVRRLVFGMHDPFPGHGGGLAAVQGMEIVGPVLEEECTAANEVFALYARERRAHVTLKAATTLDGKIATASGESKWITGKEARADGHLLRDRADAILVGARTVIADDPQLTTRGVTGGRDPLRIVLDGQLRVPPTARVLTVESVAGSVVATVAGAGDRAAALRATGADVWELPATPDGQVELRALVERLAATGRTRLLVEGGAATHAAFVRAGLADRLVLYVAPRVLGQAAAPAWLGELGLPGLEETPRFELDGPPRRLGADLCLELRPVRARAPVPG